MIPSMLSDPTRDSCLSGGDDADGERGHDQHGVPGDRGMRPDLGLVEAEVVLAELKALLGRSAQAQLRVISRVKETGWPAGMWQ